MVDCFLLMAITSVATRYIIYYKEISSAHYEQENNNAHGCRVGFVVG